MYSQLSSFFSFLPSPGSTYEDKCYEIREWYINEEPGIQYIIAKRTFVSTEDMVFNWLDRFTTYFSNDIIDDAKRIALDIKQGYNAQPSNKALIALYLSCEFHNSVNLFNNHIKDLNKIILQYKKNVFDIKTRENEFQVIDRIRRKAKTVRKDIGEEKFETLKRMWEKLEV